MTSSFKLQRAPAGQTTHRVENGVTDDLQARFNSRLLGVNVPELSLEKAHLILKRFWASWHPEKRNSQTQIFYTLKQIQIFFKLTNVLMQKANKRGCHNVPVLAAEFDRRLNPIIHHQGQVLMDGVRPMVRELPGKWDRSLISLIFFFFCFDLICIFAAWTTKTLP